MIYLDGHSTTPLDPKVFAAMQPYFLEKFGNASRGVHAMNWEAEAGVEHSRKQIADFIQAKPSELIFTSGATESNHLAILGLEKFLRSCQKMKVLSIELEHASLLGALELLKERGFEIEFVKCHKDGTVDVEDYRKKLSKEVGLVSVALANHEIGTIQDLKLLSKLAHEAGAIFHSDAVQAFGKIKLSVDDMGIDLMTISAHKVYGPKGVGALYVRRKNPRVELESIFLGGSQERGLRPGTPNTPAIVGFGEAAQILHDQLNSEIIHLKELRDLLWRELSKGLPCLLRNGPGSFEPSQILPNNLNVSVVGVDGAALLGRLKGVAVSNASACLNGTQDYSQVLTVLGVDKNLARSTLRFGVGRFNTREEMKLAASEVIEVVEHLREMEKEFAEQIGVEYKLEGCTK